LFCFLALSVVLWYLLIEVLDPVELLELGLDLQVEEMIHAFPTYPHQ
jgi:hypothetical protein